jgi:hypothetical protein
METWQVLLIATVALNAALGFGYRVYRLTKGGPMADVTGQALLGLVLAGIAVGVATDQGWARWAALLYGIFFALIVMPIWTLGVLLPMRPERIDIAFTAIYWTALVLIVVAAILV